MASLINQFIHTHPMGTAFAAVWVLVLFVTALPTPQPGDPRWYRFIFTLLHGVIGALPRILVAFNPSLASLLRLLPDESEADTQSAHPQQTAATETKQENKSDTTKPQ